MEVDIHGLRHPNTVDAFNEPEDHQRRAAATCSKLIMMLLSS